MAEQLTPCLMCGRAGVQISKAGQILHSVANGSPSLQHLRKQLCYIGAMTRSWAPQTSYTLRRNTASIVWWKIWYWFGLYSLYFAEVMVRRFNIVLNLVELGFELQTSSTRGKHIIHRPTRRLTAKKVFCILKYTVIG